MKTSKDEALKSLDDISNYCEEIDNNIPENERSGYKMLPDILKIRKYIIENTRPHGEWIPCSDSLPEEHNLYLTTIKKANGITFTTHSYFFTKEVGWSDACVIAWMPLPEPYKKEGEEK